MGTEEPAYVEERRGPRARAHRAVAAFVPALLVAAALAVLFVDGDEPARSVATSGHDSGFRSTTTTAIDAVLFEDPAPTTSEVAVTVPEVTTTSLRLPRPTVPKVVRDLVPSTVTLPVTLPTTATTAAPCPASTPWSVGETGVYTMSTSGGEGRRILPYRQGAGEPQEIVHSPDGSHLALTRLTGRTDGSDEMTTLHLVRPDGTGERELAAAATRSPIHLAWSPDGTRLALRDPGPEPGQLSTMVLDVATESVTRVAVHGYSVGFLRWSPDGRRLAWAELQGPGGVVVADVAGATVRRIDGVATQDVSWSPDGTELAAARYGGAGGAKTVDVVRADGSGARPVHAGAIRAAWSPTDRSHLVTDTGGQLHLADPDGGGATFLGNGHLHGWLGTGTAVVATSSEGIHLVDLRGCVRRLLDGRASEHALRSWSKDGSSVLFVRFA